MVTGRLVALGTAPTCPGDPWAPPAPTGHPGGGVPAGGGGDAGGGGFDSVAMVMGGGCHGNGAGDKASLELMGGDEEGIPTPPSPLLGVQGVPGTLGTVPGASWASHRGALRAERPGGSLRPGGLPQRGHLPQPAGGGVPLPVPPRALREALLHHEHPQLPPALLPHLPRPPPALPLHPRPDVSPGGARGDPWASSAAMGCGVMGVPWAVVCGVMGASLASFGVWGNGCPMGIGRGVG